MDELYQQIQQVHEWHTELLPVSQEKTVRTLATRMEPILKAIYAALNEIKELHSGGD